MENASKALIIAGAIIISILVIGLGVFIFTGASENADVSSSMNSQKAQAHNGTFTNFFGQKVSASKVKELMKQVATNNITSDTADEKGYIFVYFAAGSDTADATGNGAITSTQAVTSQVKNGYTYRVNVTNDTVSDKDNVTTDASGTKTHDPDNNAAGYYPSGYIRSIRILGNKKG